MPSFLPLPDFPSADQLAAVDPDDFSAVCKTYLMESMRLARAGDYGGRDGVEAMLVALDAQAAATIDAWPVPRDTKISALLRLYAAVPAPLDEKTYGDIVRLGKLKTFVVDARLLYAMASAPLVQADGVFRFRPASVLPIADALARQHASESASPCH